MRLLGAGLLIGGGLAVGAGALVAWRKSVSTVEPIVAAVDSPPVPLPPSPATVERLPTFKARLTGYWPFKANLNAKERLMEGGVKDRMSRPLIAIEQHIQDPIKYPYVSVAGDTAVWPYGQRLIIDAWPNLVFRVVDTGGNFFGAKKVYRIAGYEPLDICQLSSDFKKPTTASVKIVPGDSFASQVKRGTVRKVVTSGLRDQSVSFTGVFDARTPADHEALARALESELGGHPDETLLVAGWAMRNRADDLGVSVKDLLAPKGYGPTMLSGGHLSTRKVANDKSRKIADAVLDAHQVEDPTGGAIDYWVPAQQATLAGCGSVYRASKISGNEEMAKRFKRYADYLSEDAARDSHARDGLKTLSIVGEVELLGRRRVL